MKNIILILSVALLASCDSKKNNTESESGNSSSENMVTLTAAQLKSANLEIGKIEQKSISSVIKLNGKIDVPPQNMISVSMPLGGYLKTTKLLPGMHISKCEVIATMEDQQYIQLQQDYLAAKAKLEFSEAEFKRQKELNLDKASSDKVFQQSKMEYTTQKIELSALAEKLKLINVNPQTLTEDNLSKSVCILSPIDGFVSKVNVNIGKYVNPADILFELVNPTDIHLNLTVFEKDIALLSIGQQLVAYTNHEPDKKHICEIILISKDLSSDRTTEVHCHFKNYDKNLLPGMYMNADVEVKSNNVYAVAEDGVVNFEGKTFVFVSNGANQFTMAEVETGTSENGYIAILNSRSLIGKKIVTKGAYALLMTIKNKNDSAE